GHGRGGGRERRGGGGRVSSRAFTPEQAAAIADRRGSGLLAAAAGSGKTAVMVERFVESVVRDGIAVGAILALTFTEKAAGELRERIRRRLTEMREDEHARAVDAAWVGTIHGFCARVLRAQPLAAGLDPRFVVLGGAAPWPGGLDPGTLKRGAKALESDACEAYRAAFAAYRSACADHHAREALIVIDNLLDRFGSAYADAKAARAGLDFEDLELRVRDLLADPGQRRRWAERFEVVMVDEFQDTNRLQLELLEALERDNLFAVGDEFQSIYRFRHADVEIFRRRAQGIVRRLAVNFRSREELLDVLNAAFTSEFGERFSPLRAGRRETPIDPDG